MIALLRSYRALLRKRFNVKAQRARARACDNAQCDLDKIVCDNLISSLQHARKTPSGILAIAIGSIDTGRMNLACSCRTNSRRERILLSFFPIALVNHPRVLRFGGILCTRVFTLLHYSIITTARLLRALFFPPHFLAPCLPASPRHRSVSCAPTPALFPRSRYI